jgi:hypothetical protein
LEEVHELNYPDEEEEEEELSGKSENTSARAAIPQPCPETSFDRAAIPQPCP